MTGYFKRCKSCGIYFDSKMLICPECETICDEENDDVFIFSGVN